MNAYRLRLVTAKVRDELVKRGTPLPPLAQDDQGVRDQLRDWTALARVAPPLTVQQAATLVIPVVEVDRGKRDSGAD
jgi:hypothetical protein